MGYAQSVIDLELYSLLGAAHGQVVARQLVDVGVGQHPAGSCREGQDEQLPPVVSMHLAPTLDDPEYARSISSVKIMSKNKRWAGHQAASTRAE